MTDREKVIKVIECCLNGYSSCHICPYFKDTFSECQRKLHDGVIALLKEQEPKTGKWILDDEDANSWECSECGGLLLIDDGTPYENNWHFCPYCGSKLEEEKVKLDD